MATRTWTGETDGDPAIAGNWRDAAGATGAPASTDTLIIPAGATVDIDGADQSGVALTLLVIEEGCTINIGSRTNGVTTSWQINATTVITSGSGLIYLETDSVTTYTVLAAGTGANVGTQKLNILGATITALNIQCDSVSQTVGIASNSAEACTVTKGTMTGGTVVVGRGATISTSIECTGGNLTTLVAVPTLLYGGSASIEHHGGSATLMKGSGGICNYRSAVECTNVKLSGRAEMNMTKDLTGRTFTNVEMGGKSRFIDPYRTVTLTNNIDVLETGINEVTIDRGTNVTVAINAI